jgi:serine/threonine protein kinase/WD40 repeat protein
MGDGVMIDVHPDPAQLAAFRLGKLSDEELAAIERHVEECDSCCQQLKGVPDDSFVSLVRQSKPSSPVPSGEAAPVLDRGTPTWGPDDTWSERATELPSALRDHPRYEVLERLGHGGMGVVYKARHRLMERVVALKILNPRLLDKPASVERFRREVRGAGQLSHPNIVTAHDADHAGDSHFLVMEYVPGISLARLVEEQGPLPVATACNYIRQASLGLQHAFECGMVHRDIKPQNLMVVSGEPAKGAARAAQQVKILDFGLARFVSEAAEAVGQVDNLPEASGKVEILPHVRLTQASTLMGTPEFMAPEQAVAAHAADIRADIYSLGCTLYYLLTGHAPFPAGSAGEKLQAHLQQTPRPLHEVRPDVPVALAAVVDRMLAKDPAERYQKPADVAEALAQWIKEPATDPQPAPAGKPPRRRPPWWLRMAGAVAACVVLMVLAGFVIPPVHDWWMTVIRIATNRGELVIDNDDEDIEVTIKQAGADPVVVVVQKGTQRTLELTAVNGEIDVKELRTGMRFKTNELTLSRGDKVTFKASMLLDQRAGTLVIENRHPGARLQVRIVNFAEALRLLHDGLSDTLSLDPKADLSKLKIPDLMTATLAPGETLTKFLKDGSYEVTVEGIPPESFPTDTRRVQVSKGKETRLVFPDPSKVITKVEPKQPQDKQPGPAFQPLFNGKDLQGWEGDQEYWNWKNANLVGQCPPATPDRSRTVLVSKKMYENFELRFQARQQGGLGGCVGFRGQKDPRGTKFILVGPRAPINKYWAGDLQWAVGSTWWRGREASEKVFKPSDFNDYVIKCVGQRLTIQINGLTTVDEVFPELAARGVLSLEAWGGHVGDPTQMVFANMQICELPLEPPLEPLFNGQDLQGWEGNLEYWNWKNNNLVGLCPSAVADMSRTILVSKKVYENFELRFQARLLGYGGCVGFRGQKDQKLTVNGPRIPFNAEGGSGLQWTDNPRGKVHKLSKVSDFNDYVIKCVGQRLTIQINGLTAVDEVFPEMEGKGVLSLEAWGDPGVRGNSTQMVFANMQIRELPPEPRFVPLFGGKNLEGWRGDLETWTWQDGALVGSIKGRPGPNMPLLLCSTKKYKDFELKFNVQFKIKAAIFCGVRIRGRADLSAESEKTIPPGPEVALLKGIGGFYTTGGVATSFKEPRDPEALKAAMKTALMEKKFLPDGSEVHVKCVGKHVTITVWGVTTIDDDFPEIPDEGILAFNLMQVAETEREQTVIFKNVMIRELSPSSELETSVETLNFGPLKHARADQVSDAVSKWHRDSKWNRPDIALMIVSNMPQNTLTVTCSRVLSDEIKKLVEKLEKQAEKSGPGVEPPGGNAKLPNEEVRRYGDAKTPIVSVAFALAGKFVLAGGVGSKIRMWDIKTGKEERVLEVTGGTPAQHMVRSLAFSRYGDSLVTAGDMFPIHVWSGKSGKLDRTFGNGTGAGAVQFLPKENELLVLQSNLSVWDVNKGEIVRKLDEVQQGVNSVSLSADGKLALSGNTFDLWDVTTGQRLKKLTGPAAICTAALAPDGKQAIFADDKGALSLWDVATDKLVHRLEESPPQPAYTVITERVKPEIETIKKTRMFSRPGATLSMVFSADGKRVLTGGGDGGVRLWDIASGKLLARFQGGSLEQTVKLKDDLIYREGPAYAPEPAVPAVAFSPDGKYALSGSLDGTVRLWRLPDATAKDGNATADFQPLFNGKDLDGWEARTHEQEKDAAKAWVVNGNLISCLGDPVAQLRSSRSYENFILEFDFQFLYERSPTSNAPAALEIALHQEMEAAPHYLLRIEQGGMCRLSPVAGAKGQAVSFQAEPFKLQQWNKIRLTSWKRLLGLRLNDQHIGEVKDCDPLKGHFVLFAVNHPVNYRNMQVKGLRSTDPEFQPLFNGKDLAGWASDPKFWDIKDKALVSSGKESLLRTERSYENYILRFEHWVEPHMNPGSSDPNRFTLLLHDPTPEDAKMKDLERPQIEFGLSGDGAHALCDYKNRPMEPFKPFVDKKAKQFGWNKVEVHNVAGQIEVLCNGQSMVTFKSGKARKGYIGFKVQGGEWSFRNIEIQVLPADAQPPRGLLKPLFPEKNLDGWKGDKDCCSWGEAGLRIKADASSGNTYLVSDKKYRDFELKFQMRFQDVNSYVRFLPRYSEATKEKFQDTAFRIAFIKPPDQLAVPDNEISKLFKRGSEFNDVVIRCVGKRLTIQLNGKTVIDEDSPNLPAEGSLAFHVWGPMQPETTLRELEIRELPGM